MYLFAKLLLSKAQCVSKFKKPLAYCFIHKTRIPVKTSKNKDCFYSDLTGYYISLKYLINRHLIGLVVS
jgi:hypothetical protein